MTLKTLPILIGILCCMGLGLLLPIQKALAVPPTPPPPTGVWLPDDEVTFAGKSVVRASGFFGWTLSEYQWAGSDTAPLSQFWGTVRNTIFSVLILVIVAAAFAILFTRGRSVGVFEFLKRFFLAVVLILFSFAIIQLIYQITDILQSFFLRGITISDLLNVSINYSTFEGYRKVGGTYEESAFIAILLVKLTSITYNTIASLLVIRKVILWFFLIISPLFPLLILYYPLRNTAKIWIAEFFRWVLYAPLFSICLAGVVALWKSPFLSTLFNAKDSTLSTIMYPTAINILLGAPGQTVSADSSLATNSAYAQYVVALLMLWVVALLPFLLLRIFLDYVASLSLENMNANGKFELSTLPFFGGNRGGTGRAQPIKVVGENVKTVPVLPVSAMPEVKGTIASSISGGAPIGTAAFTMPTSMEGKTLAPYGLADFHVPTLRDIARLDRGLSATSPIMRADVAKMQETLSHIGAPERIVSASDRQNFTNVQNNLQAAQAKGDPMAASVLIAARQIAHATEDTMSNTPSGKSGEKSQVTKLPITMPVENTVQQVKLDDFESVHDLWKEHYANAQPPADTSRSEWLTNEKDQADKAIAFLQSDKPEDIAKGQQIVSQLIPFLTAGGFSKGEVISYLQAKSKAASEALTELNAPDHAEGNISTPEEKKA